VVKNTPLTKDRDVLKSSEQLIDEGTSLIHGWTVFVHPYTQQTLCGNDSGGLRPSSPTTRSLRSAEAHFLRNRGDP
jgi:hypothetical protein